MNSMNSSFRNWALHSHYTHALSLMFVLLTPNTSAHIFCQYDSHRHAFDCTSSTCYIDSVQTSHKMSPVEPQGDGDNVVEDNDVMEFDDAEEDDKDNQNDEDMEVDDDEDDESDGDDDNNEGGNGHGVEKGKGKDNGIIKESKAVEAMLVACMRQEIKQI